MQPHPRDGRWRTIGPALLLTFSLACATLAPAAPPASPTTAPAPTEAPPPTSTLAPTPSPDTASDDLRIGPGDLTLHPDPALYSGDRVSFEVFAQSSDTVELKEVAVAIYLDSSTEPLAQGQFGQFGIGARTQATFTWAWNTTGLEGAHTLRAVLDPEDQIRVGDEDPHNNTLVVPVTIHPAGALPPPEPGARWAQAGSDCCIFNYVTSTAAERDLPEIMAAAERGVTRAEQTMGVELTRPITFNMISRLLGHGGFASGEITVSYLDRDYAGGGLDNVFTHEAAHVLDGATNDGFRPSLLVEGLAVYVAGGHFKDEALDLRAAALLATGRMVPLAELTDSFYPSQHEIGYLEGGAFIQYLVHTYGWDRFNAFYHDIPNPQGDEPQSQVLDTALAAHFERGLSEMEADWHAALRALPVLDEQVSDLLQTVSYYDTARRYQQLIDPSAYFLQAWIPDLPTARRDGIVADYVRHPNAPENVALETMMVAADRALKAGEYAETGRLLAEVNAVLDGVVAERPDPFAESELASKYLAIVHAVEASGYEAQRIDLAGDTARVSAIGQWPQLNELSLAQTDSRWTLVAGN